MTILSTTSETTGWRRWRRAYGMWWISTCVPTITLRVSNRSFCLHEIFWWEAFILLSFRLEQSFQQAYEQDSSQHEGVHRLLACKPKKSYSTTISQTQGRRAIKDGAEDIGGAETNWQFGHSVLQQRHRSCRASRRLSVLVASKKYNFLSDCLSHFHSFYLLCLLW